MSRADPIILRVGPIEAFDITMNHSKYPQGFWLTLSDLIFQDLRRSYQGWKVGPEILFYQHPVYQLAQFSG
jgi:hypothetical protein